MRILFTQLIWRPRQLLLAEHVDRVVHQEGIRHSSRLAHLFQLEDRILDFQEVDFLNSSQLLTLLVAAAEEDGAVLLSANDGHELPRRAQLGRDHFPAVLA